MENSRKGLFYGLVGVATLVVAIIGATYAYFSVTQTSDDYLYGKAATAGLNVNVVRMTGWSASEGASINANNAAYVMVPQLDTTLDQAIIGTNGNECIDAGGSLVCSIYRIIVQNTGSAPITVEGSIDFYGSTLGTSDKTTTGESGKAGQAGDNLMHHLKWARLTQPTSVKDGEYTYAQVIDGGSLDEVMPTSLLTYTNDKYVDGKPEVKGYQVTPDKIVYSYQNVAATVNRHFYAISVTGTETETTVDGEKITTSHIDLLNGHKVSGAHGRYTDLIDPTGDLSVTFNSSATPKTATVGANVSNTNGKWYLAAKDNAGDTKVFYIVVWISENKEQQNYVDFGQFTGTVTFNSSAGSGASSTFTESVQG